MPVDINGTTGVTTPGLASTAMPTSGGDPVVESGSNSDGKWTRWADGTQICSHFDPTIRGITSSPGSVHFTSVVVYQLPAAFLNNSYRVSGSSEDENNWGLSCILVNAQANGKTATSLGMRGVAAISGATLKHGYTAIGRWK